MGLRQYAFVRNLCPESVRMNAPFHSAACADVLIRQERDPLGWKAAAKVLRGNDPAVFDQRGEGQSLFLYLCVSGYDGCVLMVASSGL